MAKIMIVVNIVPSRLEGKLQQGFFEATRNDNGDITLTESDVVLFKSEEDMCWTEVVVAENK